MSSQSNKPLVSPEVLERLPPEAVEIILMLLERIEELERRLGMTPQNSSLPPSSQHPHVKPTPKKSKSNPTMATFFKEHRTTQDAHFQN